MPRARSGAPQGAGLKKGLAAAPEASIGTGTASVGGRKSMRPRAQVHDQEESCQHGALTSFMPRKFEIDAMLQRLTELSVNHFGVDPEDIVPATVRIGLPCRCFRSFMVAR
jgi:hypothetical protein